MPSQTKRCCPASRRVAELTLGPRKWLPPRVLAPGGTVDGSTALSPRRTKMRGPACTEAQPRSGGLTSHGRTGCLRRGLRATFGRRAPAGWRAYESNGRHWRSISVELLSPGRGSRNLPAPAVALAARTGTAVRSDTSTSSGAWTTASRRSPEPRITRGRVWGPSGGCIAGRTQHPLHVGDRSTGVQPSGSV